MAMTRSSRLAQAPHGMAANVLNRTDEAREKPRARDPSGCDHFVDRLWQVVNRRGVQRILSRRRSNYGWSRAERPFLSVWPDEWWRRRPGTDPHPRRKPTRSRL